MRLNFIMSGMWTGIRRNAGMTVALILSTAIALAFVGASILANTEISKFRQSYEGKLNVSVYLCAKVYQPPCRAQTTPAQTANIEAMLKADPMVKSFDYVSEQQQYERAKVLEGPAVGRLLQVGQLPASFTVKLDNIQSDYDVFAAHYITVEGVGYINNQLEAIRTLLDIIDGARWFSVVIAIVVLIASILLIANTIQVAAAQRKNETSIMRLVGASRWMTELPFILEAVIATVIGAVISGVLVWIGKHYILDEVFRTPVQNNVLPNLSINDVLVASGAGLIVGVVLAAVTAFLTLRLRVRL